MLLCIRRGSVVFTKRIGFRNDEQGFHGIPRRFFSGAKQV